MSRRKSIYILGGMGPQASVELYRMLISKAQTQYNAIHNDDYPEIVIHSVPVPDFISSPRAKGQSLDMLMNIVKSLDEDKVGSFAIACNTAHLLAGELEKATEVKFVSMIDAVLLNVKQQNINKIGILASPTTLHSGLYQNLFADHNIELIQPSKHQIIKLDKVIRSIISGSTKPSDTLEVLNIANNLQEQGVMKCILGCTELPLLFGRQQLSERFISSTESLVDSLLAQYYK